VAKKLYVGNLAYAVTDQDLKDLFSESGTVESVAVISDKFSGQSKGFGFVEMADAAGAEAAIKSLDGTEFKGRNLKVNEAKPREGGSSGGPRGGGGGGGRSGDRSGGGGRGKRWYPKALKYEPAVRFVRKLRGGKQTSLFPPLIC